MLRLYNSLTRRKEDFKPIDLNGKLVKMYSCGPTVYDHAHIGNMRAYITADLLVRALQSEGYGVQWVMNLTDIDDKIIDRLQRDYPDDEPKTARVKLAEKFTKLFYQDLDKVNVQRQNIEFTAATDFIPQMRTIIRRLVDEDIAYVSDGSVYFNLKKYQDQGYKYGLLVNVDFAAEARVTDDQDQKEGAADFALWKAKKANEPSWDFDLNGQNLPGRPGWHIECTAMSTDRLGPEFDIHTGGVDLKFPHHENEIAQNEGKLARFFVHNEHLHVAGEKMSKSADNFMTLEDIDDPMAFRYLVLQAHYRSQMNFTDEALQGARNRLKNLRYYADQLNFRQEKLPKMDETGVVEAFSRNFKKALEDDLNTPEALAAITQLDGKIYTQDALHEMKKIDEILGLKLFDNHTLSVDVKDMIKVYEEARIAEDYNKSDEIRKKIDDAGYITTDSDNGTRIARKDNTTR